MEGFEEVKGRWASRCWQCGQEFAPSEERRQYGIGLWCHPACWLDVLVGMEAEVEARATGMDERGYQRLLEEFMDEDNRVRRDEAFRRTSKLFGMDVARGQEKLADEAMRCVRKRKKRIG